MGRPIILDEDWLHDAFLPERTLCREQHVEDIVGSLSPFKQNKPAKNLYIFGAPGAGKTTVVREVLRQHFSDTSVYVNCWSNRTAHKVMEEILRQTGSMIHGKESTSELIKRFENSGKKIVICLDEFDHLKDKDILYVFSKASCPVVLISNHPYSPSEVDARVKSRLHLQEIEFGTYQNSDIDEILKDRIMNGLNSESITDELVAEIARSSGGDARAGIQILKSAAIDAESKGLESITMDHIKSAAGCARKYRLSYLLRKLNDHQKVLYDLLKQNRSMSSGDLFNEYKKQTDETVTDRSYRNYMGRLVELGLVRKISSGRWKRYEIII